MMKIMNTIKVSAIVTLLAVSVIGCTTTVTPGAGAQWNTPNYHCWVNGYGVQHCVPRAY